MRYYVVSDVHGYYSALEKELKSKGFFEDKAPHKLIICGDAMDRGGQAMKMQEFMKELLQKDELIYIKGNHEDLLVDMISNIEENIWSMVSGRSHHVSNGTYDTALQLSGMSNYDAWKDPEAFANKVKESIFCKELLPNAVDYFETDDYIFVHGWIPCFTNKDMPAWYRKKRHYEFNPNWRNSGKDDWDVARWFNGMELAELHDVVERGKTIVCGHWHASYGHANFEKKGSEFGADAVFTPYRGKNILAIDACTAHTGIVNCVIIEN